MAGMKDLRNKFGDHMARFKIENGHNTEHLIDNSSPKAIEDSKQLVSSAILHACDISTSLRDFDVSE